MQPTTLFLVFACLLATWEFADGRTYYSYSRYSYSSSVSRTSTTAYSRYTYRYSSSYTSYSASSIRYTPATYSYSYSYYTGLYYSYYYYTYYSYYYGSTCTRATSGSYSVDSCSSPTTTTTTTTTAPATVTCASSGATLTSNVGYFNSHTGYGSVDYTNSMSCRWTIYSNPGKVVQLSFVSFSTEKNYDYVRVYDGSGTTAALLATFHGTSSSDSGYPGSTILYSTGQYMHIVFTTDSSVTKTGFSALYQQVTSGSLPPTAAPTTPTATTVSSGTPETYCSGVQMRDSNTSYLIASHSSATGLLPSATSGLAQYRNQMNCTWLVAGSPGSYLTFHVNYMNLESCYDRLSIYKSSATSGNLLRMYCDASTPMGVQAVVAVPVQGMSAVVTFTTDGSITRQGFILTYNYLTNFTSDSYSGNSSSSSSSSSDSASRTNNVCRNYNVNARGSAMGSFTCPNPFEPSDFTQCCGSENEQYCCKLQDNTPMLIGCIVGCVILVVVVVVIFVCCCRTCRETQIKKNDTGSNWRRTLNKTRAITAWKRLGTSGGAGGSTAALVANTNDLSAGAAAGPSGRTGNRYANLMAAVDGPSFTPPPVPPPSALYFGGGGGGGGGGGYGMGHFAPTYPTAPPPAYDTAYPPQQQSFRM